MKSIIIQLVSLCLCAMVYFSCKSANKATDQVLYVVGTTHFPSEGINADSIIAVLRELKPDVILMELDSSAFDSDFNFTISLDENEYNAVGKYLKEALSLQIRPIEFEGRDAYRKSQGLSPNPGQTYDILGQLAQDGKLIASEKEVWDRFIEYYNKTSRLVEGNLRGLNLSASDRLTDSLMFYQYIKVKQIVDARDEFDELMIDSKGDSVSIEEHFQRWSEFEYRSRNNAMVNNIVRTINSFPDKEKFVLLVGFQHRFYIKKELAKRDLNFAVQEFYE